MRPVFPRSRHHREIGKACSAQSPRKQLQNRHSFPWDLRSPKLHVLSLEAPYLLPNIPFIICQPQTVFEGTAVCPIFFHWVNCDTLMAEVFWKFNINFPSRVFLSKTSKPSPFAMQSFVMKEPRSNETKISHGRVAWQTL